MPEAIRRFFSEDGFMPHGMCYLWQPGVLGLHVASDALITLAYFSIPFTLLWFVRRRHDLQFQWMFVCFAVFIVACGSTHLMEIWTIWHPTYWLSGTIKAITALASVPTAILLVRLMPQALLVPSPGLLRKANAELESEVAVRKRAEGDVRRLNEELERRVEERTRQLELSNRNLQREIDERLRVEQSLRRSETRQRQELGRLELLDRITRAVGERQDLDTILQTVLGRLEDELAIDFGCVCLYDAANQYMTVASIGERSQLFADKLKLTHGAHIPVDQDGLARCVQGRLVYEPELAACPFPFPERLASAGLHSLVAAPLFVETRVSGVLLAARRTAQSFDNGDCEFLRQLSEHVALAAHQAQLYSALQHAYEDLRQTQLIVMQQERLRALGQMASGIAHDVNNALSPAVLYMESLLERETDLKPSVRQPLVIIHRAIEDVANTVARLREFYRSREPQLALTPVALNSTIEHVVALTKSRWHDMPQERGSVIRLDMRLAADLPDIRGEQSEIRDALVNLVLNAVDAMPTGGTLTLQSSIVRKHVQVEVRDTGQGMDDETRRQCLEPFFTTKGERGTGLGLAMAYGTVQRHGAEIEIDSIPGRGTTMRILFPVAARADSPTTGQAEAPRRPAHCMRVLVIDDDPLLIQSLRDAMEGDGHVVVTANGGQQGIDTFTEAQRRGESFSIVITDLGMPHVDGRRVASAIKAAAPHTPIVLLTGWGQRILAEQDIPEHVDRVLSKPPKLRELREVLADLGTIPAVATLAS